MENKNVVISAFLLAVTAILLVFSFKYWREADEIRDILRPEMIHVMIAARDLPAGTTLNEECVDVRDLPRRFIENEAYELHSSADSRLISKMVAIVRIPKGNQLIRSSLRIPVALPSAAAKPDDLGDTTPSQKHYLEGVKHFQNSDYMKARKEWKQAIKLDPSNNDAAAGLYRISQILNDKE